MSTSHLSCNLTNRCCCIAKHINYWDQITSQLAFVIWLRASAQILSAAPGNKHVRHIIATSHNPVLSLDITLLFCAYHIGICSCVIDAGLGQQLSTLYIVGLQVTWCPVGTFMEAQVVIVSSQPGSRSPLLASLWTPMNRSFLYVYCHFTLFVHFSFSANILLIVWSWIAHFAFCHWCFLFG